MPTNHENRQEDYRNKLLGLGESSLRKNYYPELRKHMRELEESRTRYKTIFNATADALFIHDAHTYEIIDFNERVCQLFGYTANEIKNITFQELCENEPPYTFDNAVEYFRKAHSVGIQNFEWKSIKKDGTVFWCDVMLKTAIIDEKQCFIASVRDITSRKHLEEQLIHSQKIEAIGQLAGGIAHDFNNMLSGIIGAAEIINSISAKNNKINKMSELILNAADTAQNLTKQLLSFSRKDTIKQEPILIHHAIHNANDILERSLARNIELVTDLQANTDLILGESSLIENVIINLSLNARDAMPNGGILKIKTDNRVTENSIITNDFAIPKDGCICITISDTGMGMTQETKKHIFEPFYTTKESGKGTGLGLAAVYNAVQKHNGFIEVESILNQGTSFMIYLPIISQAPTTNETDKQKPVHGTGKILLIDDEDILRRVGEGTLSHLGYSVITAEDGVRGIEEFKKHSPDLVLLDMVMPNMDSADCFRELNRLDPTIPIIAISGFTSDATIEELFKEGLAGFMEKPIKTNVLSHIISSTLRSYNK